MPKLVRRKFATKYYKRALHDKIGGIVANTRRGSVVALTGPAGVEHVREYKCILFNRMGYNEFHAVELRNNVVQSLYRQKNEMENILDSVRGKLFIRHMDIFTVMQQLKPETKVSFIDLDFCSIPHVLLNDGIEIKIVNSILGNESLTNPFSLAVTIQRRAVTYIQTTKFISRLKELFVLAGYKAGTQYEFPYNDVYSPPMLTWLGAWRYY